MDAIENPTELSSTPSTETKNQGDDVICIFGSIPLVQNSRGVQDEITHVRLGNDIEAIHRIRVASRRLRTALSLFQNCLPSKKINSWNRRIRELTRVLGNARDIDVQNLVLTDIYKSIPDRKMKPGIQRLLLRISQQREKAQADVLSAMDSLEKQKVLLQIEKRFTPLADLSKTVDFQDTLLFQLAFETINRRLNDFLSYEVYIRRPEYKTELHAMRIAAKRLRYSMEVFAQLYPSLLKEPLDATRKAQTIIGDIHDCDVWLDFIPAFLEKEKVRMQRFYGHSRFFYRLVPGFEYFLSNRKKERDRQYLKFLKCWRDWTQKEIWINLRETILLAISIQPQVSTQNEATPKPS